MKRIAFAFALVLSGCGVGDRAGAGTPRASSLEDGVCEVSGVAQAYVRTIPGWSIVNRASLPRDDQALWDTYHEHQCPGATTLDLDGSNREFIALALINGERDHLRAQLVVLLPDGTAQILVEPMSVTSPFVVWRATAGEFVDRTSGVAVQLVQDSIVFEKMESISRQFYIRDGEFHELLAAE